MGPVTHALVARVHKYCIMAVLVAPRLEFHWHWDTTSSLCLTSTISFKNSHTRTLDQQLIRESESTKWLKMQSWRL